MVTNESNIKEECEILLQAAVPEIYRLNAFRISGLNVNASTREISNQLQKNRMSEKYGSRTEITESPLPILPSPDTDQMRTALHRLRDPETRIIDEFFWFWPHSLETNQKDQALESLSRNDITSAESSWINSEATFTESKVSKHNLAILSHLLALDMEQNGQLLAEEEINKRDEYWKNTFTRWKLLLDHEGFWSRLMARVRQMDDPRLTTGFVKRLRGSLPTSILKINALLALKAAESGNEKDAVRHLNLINNSGFGKEAELEALKQVINPLRNRIKIICKSFAEETYSDSLSEFKACKKLLGQTKGILQVIDIMLPPESIIKEGAHDEVTLTATTLAISYANATEDWESAVEIFELLKNIAIGDSAKDKVIKNYNIFIENIEYDLIHKTCFFCNKNKFDEKSKIIVSMHGDVRRVEVYQIGTTEYEKPYYGEYTFNPVYIKWNYNKIEVPRCEACEKEHESANSYILLGGGIGSIIGIIAGYIIGGDNGGIWAIFVLTILGLIIGGIYRSSKLNTKSYSHYKKFPMIKEKLKNGWTWGEKPPNDTV